MYVWFRQHLHQVLGLVENMGEQGAKPDVRTFNKLIHNCAQA